MPHLDGAAPTPQTDALTGEPDRQQRHQHLRLLSYNIQVGISSTRFRHYVTQSWRHVLPNISSFSNLDQIARLISDFDIVALQEVDAGSFRSFFVNQVEYLARRGKFPYWYFQTNRNLGKFAQHSNGLLSKLAPQEIIEHKLPGVIPGRGVMEVRYGSVDNPLVVLLVHLGLGRRARLRQLAYLSRLVNEHRHAIVMGDFNCQTQSEEMTNLLNHTELCEPAKKLLTFPSWRPLRNIDHILVSASIQTRNVEVLPYALSDHLPIAIEVMPPKGIRL